MKRALQIIICLCCIGAVVYFAENYVRREKHVSPPVVKKELKKPEPKKVFKGKISIIIDDVGYNEKLALMFARLNIPLAFSCLPYAPYTREIANKLHEMGYTVMLHMPCEPIHYPFHGLGPGALFVDTSEKEIEKRLEEAYRNVPFAEGLDVHEGSRFSQSADKMDIVMRFLKRKCLFFVDSMTTPRSVGYLEAEDEGIPFAKRDVFLDNVKDVSYIKKQLNSALYIACRKGRAIAIAHCDKVTYEALKESIGILNKSDIQIVDIKRNLCTF